MVEILYEDIDGKIYNHVAIAINDTVYSYAFYNSTSPLQPIVADGSILVCDKDNYISVQTEDGRVITAYELNLTQEEEASLLGVMNGYIEGATKQEVESKYRGTYYYGKWSDGLKIYTVLKWHYFSIGALSLSHYTFGGNCVDFVNKALDDAGIPRTLFTQQARFLPAFTRASLERAYLEHKTNIALFTFLGATYRPSSGAVVNKTVYS